MSPRPPIDTLVVDDLSFAVRWSTRRRTVGITVKRDGTLTVAAPRRTSLRKIEAVVRDKLPWVRRKLAEFAALGPPPEPRRGVAGELFPYLGREYVLRLVDRPPQPADRPPQPTDQPPQRSDGSPQPTDRPPQPVALRGDALEVDRTLDGDARAAVVAWYEQRAREYLGEAVARLIPLVGAAPAAVVVRDLGKRRWGVCDHRTLTVTFHWQLVTLPPDLVDYVVAHELAHLHEPNHGAAFWRRVEDVLPDCRERRRRLSRRGDELVF